MTFKLIGTLAVLILTTSALLSATGIAADGEAYKQESKGAFYTKEYRNVFKEFGYTEQEIDKKVDKLWNDMFYGNNNTRIYYPAGNDMGYILDTGNLDVRTEGMSYGMMMCVQMDKKKEFDSLWKWAKTYMQIQEEPNKGYFKWSIKPDGTSNSQGPAPDGEEYFAMALFFASHRWGDSKAPFDYSNQARYILRQCLHQEDDGLGNNMWNLSNKLIKFVPGVDFTDPSYHLPHFYELFALWANPEDRPFWKAAAAASRAYLKKACHPLTGLAPDYSEYDGTPKAVGGHDIFSSDAFRVAGNIGLDYAWFAADPWEVQQSNAIQAFFVKEGLKKHYSNYSIDGRQRIEGTNYQSRGLSAMYAMASLAADGPNVKAVVDNLWKKPFGQGQWRYYDDCLQFFGVLALSGKYRIW